MKVNYGFKVSDEVVKTNVKEGTTELDTKDEKGKDVIMYNDFNKVRGIRLIQACEYIYQILQY